MGKCRGGYSFLGVFFVDIIVIRVRRVWMLVSVGLVFVYLVIRECFFIIIRWRYFFFRFRFWCVEGIKWVFFWSFSCCGYFFVEFVFWEKFIVLVT